MRGVTIAVVGLGFGQDFVPIYLAHPDVENVVLVEPDRSRRLEVAARFGLDDDYHPTMWATCPHRCVASPEPVTPGVPAY